MGKVEVTQRAWMMEGIRKRLRYTKKRDGERGVKWLR